VAVSEAARTNLVSRHGIPNEKIECVRGFIQTAERPRADRATLRRALAAEVGIPEHARIVGASGMVYWLKGCDLFLQLAVAIRKRAPAEPVHFLWVGTKPSGDGFSSFEHDIEHAGLTGFVHFIGPRPNPLDYIGTFDVHALVSREESLSLVMLEAAVLGVPTICFDGAGGAVEFVQDDAGATVPYLDVEAMADRVLDFIRTDDLRESVGRRAHQKALEQHDIGVSAPRLVQIVERLIASASHLAAARG
jgi:glycosyltransferase involved in cell wall biosynthesis